MGLTELVAGAAMVGAVLGGLAGLLGTPERAYADEKPVPAASPEVPLYKRLIDTYKDIIKRGDAENKEALIRDLGDNAELLVATGVDDVPDKYKKNLAILLNNLGNAYSTRVERKKTVGLSETNYVVDGNRGIALLNLAISIHASHTFFYNRGVLNARLGRKSEARKDLYIALEEDPKSKKIKSWIRYIDDQ